tara:strand:- start:4098 stop:4748 length:651 start_codon:yes stop_codon:yes gene_type:complete
MIYGTSGNALFGKEDELRRILELAQRAQLNPDISFRANPANYRNNPRGNILGDAALNAAELGGTVKGKYLNKVKGTNLGNVVEYLVGNRPDATQRQVVKDVFGLSKKVPGVAPKAAVHLGRFAGRIAPGLSAIGNITDVADIITGDESLANKAMDATGMGLGGTAGFIIGGPLGASIGAGLGKTASDGIQYLVGGGKSPEERRMEEALRALRGGQI